jgi:hypothetical protein
MKPQEYWDYVMNYIDFFNRWYDLTGDRNILKGEMYEALVDEVYRLSEPFVY